MKKTLLVLFALMLLLTSAEAQNLALNQPVTVSSSETWSGNTAEKLTDGSTSTRWSSEYSDPQWAYVDLGSSYTIDRVVLKWEGAYGSSYEIQVSDNASSWSTIYNTTTGDGGTDDLSLSGTGRYVRIYGTIRATSYGYSLWEMEVYEGSTPNPDPDPDPNPDPSVNLALNGSSTASSQENSDRAASNVTDANESTRWASQYSDPQWIYVDLGSNYDISRVVLNWEAAYGSAYQIQTSNDASSWTTIYNTSSGNGGIDDISVSGSGRYVRMYGTTRGTSYGYSLWEFEVYEGENTDPDPDPDPEGVSIPSKIEAENYTAMSGIQTEGTSDTGGGENVGWIDNGDWMDYEVYVENAGTYSFEFRIASLSNAIKFDLKNGSTVLTSVNEGSTGNWQNWTTVTKSAYLNSGSQTLRIAATGGGWNINFINVTSGTPDPDPDPDPTPDDPDIFAQNQLLRYGINLSGMESPDEGDWGAPLTENEFKRSSEIGFKSVRVPIRWDTHASNSYPYTIDTNWFERVDWVIAMAKKYNLALIINMHHYDNIHNDPYGEQAKYNSMWRQIAERYQNEPNNVFFELLNEPTNQLDDYNKLNDIHNGVIPIIRETNPHRSLLVSGKWSGAIKGLNDPLFSLPADDRDIILTGHYYNPLNFTHQGAWWCDCGPIGVTWGESWDTPWVDADLNEAINYAAEQKRPLHLGEYGVLGTLQDGSQAADRDSRFAWLDYVTKFALNNSMSWSHWEFKGNFGIYTPETDEFDAQMAQAILQDAYIASNSQKSATVGEPNIQQSFKVEQNYPNPFVQTTTISYSLKDDAKVTLTVYDMMGREIKSLVNTLQPQGSYKVEFNADSGNDTCLPAGIYYYKINMVSEDQIFTETKKMMLLE
ncbi:MAG: cellulase family glycosylhydrolase [Prolixibacteraceae bacterium]